MAKDFALIPLKADDVKENKRRLEAGQGWL